MTSPKAAPSTGTGVPWRGRLALVVAGTTGGIGSHVADVARRLGADGVSVTVFGPAATNQRFGFDRDGTVSFVPVETAAGNPVWKARRRLRRALARVAPHVVHAHGLRAAAVTVLARPRRPLVVTLHNAVLATGAAAVTGRVAGRLVARRADLILTASPDLAEGALAAGARDARHLPVVAPHLPPPQRDRAAVRADLGVEEDRPLILAVGRLHPQKAHHVLVDAAARWRDWRPVPAVVVAGDGPARVELTRRIEATGAPVRLLGHRSDVSDLLAAADLAVVTSVWEGWQLFAQEALRAGVPLVTTAVGGNPALVGDAALLVPPRDVDALDAAVRRLLDDPALRARYAEAGPRRAASWPTPEQTAATLREFYAQLATGSAPAAGPGWVS